LRSAAEVVPVDDMTSIVVLRPGDEEALSRFLSRYPDTSMFLRSNLRQAGLVDRGEPMQATYAAARMSSGEIVAVAAHCWNGVMLLQAPSHVDELSKLAMKASGRRLLGLSGPLDQVVEARKSLEFDNIEAILDRPEVLFALSLDDIVVPAALQSGEVHCRRSEDDDFTMLRRWRMDFCMETLNHPDTPALRESCGRDVWHAHERGLQWVLSTDDGPVAMSTFNAALPDSVQVGGVWTPKVFRGRGYAKCVVAGSLVVAREEGVKRAVLFTDESNASAQSAYTAIGFRPAGAFGLVLFS
jgi:uncharacterized protein